MAAKESSEGCWEGGAEVEDEGDSGEVVEGDRARWKKLVIYFCRKGAIPLMFQTKMRMVSWLRGGMSSPGLGELILIGGDNFRLLVGGGVILWSIVLLVAMYLVPKSFLAILYGWLKKN